jgi:hypothetical protein
MNVLTHGDIAKIAPAVYNKEKHERVSSRYTFIPTDRIVNDLREVDWYPVHVEAVHSRKQSIDHAKHMLKFRARDDMSIKHEKTGDVVIPELVITNSHDGKNAFRAHIGIFRVACSNGLLVSDGVTGGYQSMRVTHKGYDEKTVLKMINHTIDGFSQVLKNIETYRETKMTEREQIDMAERAIDLRWQYNYTRPDGIKPEMFLERRRDEDKENNLWNVYNTIQENMSRGGIHAFNTKGRRIVTRPIKNIRENLRFNKGIWGLLAQTYEKVK